MRTPQNKRLRWKFVKTRTVLLAFVCLAISACGRGTPADVNAVYSEFLNQPSLREYFADPPCDTFIALSKTVTWYPDKEADASTRWARFHERFPTLKRDTYEDFWAKNAEPNVLTLSTTGSKPVRLITEEELDTIFKRGLDGWESYRKEFPTANGYIGLSALGFSRDGQQALVYFQTSSDWLAGFGSYYLLARTETGWKIAAEDLVWVS